MLGAYKQSTCYFTACRLHSTNEFSAILWAPCLQIELALHVNARIQVHDGHACLRGRLGLVVFTRDAICYEGWRRWILESRNYTLYSNHTIITLNSYSVHYIPRFANYRRQTGCHSPWMDVATAVCYEDICSAAHTADSVLAPPTATNFHIPRNSVRANALCCSQMLHVSYPWQENNTCFDSLSSRMQRDWLRSWL